MFLKKLFPILNHEDIFPIFFSNVIKILPFLIEFVIY